MQFDPGNITKEHILQGVEKIEKEKLDLNSSIRYDVLINGKTYPPKEIMKYAHEQMNGVLLWNYSGGELTNKWLKKFNFKIIDRAGKGDPRLDLISRYKEYTRESKLKDELYKWELIKTFNGRPDTNASNFNEEFTSIDFDNLIYRYGKSAILQLVKERPEEVREFFIYLFNEDIELSDRISYFNQQTLKLYKELPETKNLNHHQDERTIATYLAFHDSSKYAIFKDSFYQKYCRLIGVKPQNTGEKLVHYLTLIEDFIENYISNDNELLELKEQFLTEDCFEDMNHMIFAQDILYTTLDQQKGLGRSYWKVGLSNDQVDLWSTMQDGQYISIGWSEIGDLSKQGIQNKNDILRLLDENGYEGDQKSKEKYAVEIFNFYNNILKGDIILAQDGSKILGIGEVIGNYEYDLSVAPSHYISVEWKITLPPFNNTEKPKSTIHKISQADVIHQVDTMLKECIKEQKMGNELNQILYGPPGTGKTYNTINKALELCGEDISGLSRSETKDLFERKMNEGKIIFTTFHQSMTYEDFVEGIKPVEPENEGDPVVYRVEEGIFRKLCVEASFSLAQEQDSSTTENVLDFSLAFDNLVQEIEDKLASEEVITLVTKNGGKVVVDGISQQGNIIIKHPGKENTYPVSKQRLSKLHAAFPDLGDVNNIDQQFRSIIGGSNSTANWSVLNAIRNLNPVVNESSKDLRKFSWDDKVQVVKSMRKEDYKGKIGDPYVLIIDEINRGNVSQIFGELITLIEEDKRLGKSESLQVQLPYSKESFGVPPNLYILGTMNTADRSVEALDTALRRRFSFTEMPPKPELIKTEGKVENGIVHGIDLSILLEIINKRIEKLLDKDHTIGHSYFLSVGDIKDLKSVFQNKIIPLLQEYFFGDYGKIGLVIGSRFFDIKEDEAEENVFAPFEDYDSSPFLEKKIYHLVNVQRMSDEEFVQALNIMQRKNS